MPLKDRITYVTRRHFLGRTATGLGTAALASLLQNDASARIATHTSRVILIGTRIYRWPTSPISSSRCMSIAWPRGWMISTRRSASGICSSPHRSRWATIRRKTSSVPTTITLACSSSRRGASIWSLSLRHHLQKAHRFGGKTSRPNDWHLITLAVGKAHKNTQCHDDRCNSNAIAHQLALAVPLDHIAQE